MGRRNLIRAAALAALTLAAAAPAGAAGAWKVLADGASQGRPVAAPVAYLALTRAATGAFSARLGGAAAAPLSRVDFSKTAVVAIFGEFGCEDSLIEISALSQQAGSLSVKLVRKQPPPGSAECMAIFGTYRLLAVPKTTLRKPYPTRALVIVARS